MIRGRPCHVVVLLPSVEAVAAREAGRATKGYATWQLEEFYDGFVETTPRVGIWLDTTNQTPEQTVAEVISRTRSQVIAQALRAPR